MPRWSKITRDGRCASPVEGLRYLPRVLKAAALGVSLLLSALLTVAAMRSPDHHWLAWISFLPLFVVVRCLRPRAAALAGGLWGAGLYVFCTSGPTPAVGAVGPAIDPTAPILAPSFLSLAILIVIPAVYVGLAALPGRPISFKLLTLALGWPLVEAVLHLHRLSGPHESLLASTQSELPHLHWLARLLGYVFTALLVACANASLVGILSRARLSLPPCRSLPGSLSSDVCFLSQVFLRLQLLALRQSYPRAPPIPVTVPSWNLVGSAHWSL